MPFYIQHDESGNITATILGSTAPEHPSQIELPEWVDTRLKRVDLATMEVVDCPVLVEQERIAELASELAFLDMSIPRGLEDMWAATGFDTTTLPAATQGKLARKAELRNALK